VFFSGMETNWRNEMINEIKKVGSNLYKDIKYYCKYLHFNTPLLIGMLKTAKFRLQRIPC